MREKSWHHWFSYISMQKNKKKKKKKKNQ